MPTRRTTPTPEPTEEPTPEATPEATPEDGVRRTVNAWWCPECDRAHTHAERVCDGCGYELK